MPEIPGVVGLLPLKATWARPLRPSRNEVTKVEARHRGGSKSSESASPTPGGRPEKTQYMKSLNSAPVLTTGWVWWDPIAAFLAALNIIRVGFKLIRESLGGLLDESDLAVEGKIRGLLDKKVAESGISYHNLRYRHSGRTHWVEFHLVFEDDLTVGEAHVKATEIEAGVAEMLHPDGRVISHLEPKSAENEVESWEGR